MNAPSAATTSSEWPFTPEVESGGWQIDTNGYGIYVVAGFPDPDALLNATPKISDEDLDKADAVAEAQQTANINLIAAAPQLYKIAKKMKEVGFEWPELAIIEWIEAGWKDPQ